MEPRGALLSSVVLFHVALVPLVVLGTNLILGYQNALTPSNQMTWTPIISAQSALLSAYLAFGGGPTRRRLLWFIAGCLELLFAVVFAYSLLCDFPEPRWAVFFSQLRTNSLWVVIPPAVSGLLMMFVRPWFGEVRHPSGGESSLGYSVLDVLAVTTLLCASITWFSYVAKIPVEASNAERIADIIPILPLLSSALWRGPLVMTMVWLVFSDRKRLFAVVPFLLVGVANLHDFSLKTFGLSLYAWVLVLVTLLVFRWAGYRLLGRMAGDEEGR